MYLIGLHRWVKAASPPRLADWPLATGRAWNKVERTDHRLFEHHPYLQPEDLDRLNLGGSGRLTYSSESNAFFLCFECTDGSLDCAFVSAAWPRQHDP